MRAIRLLTVLALGAALGTGCTNNKVQLDQAKLIGTVAQAASCVAAVNATASDPACRAPLAPCRAAYESGRDLVGQ